MRPDRRPTAIALAASSALLLVAAHEPIGLGVLGWVALIPLYVAVLRAPRVRDAALLGAVCGLVFFGIHLSWIFLFGWMALLGLVVLMAAFVAGAAALARSAARLPLAPLLAASAWAGSELLRDRIPAGGFSWGALGTTQAGVPVSGWLAGVVGAFGLSLLAALTAAVVADRIVFGRLSWGSLAVCGVVLAGFAGLDAVRYGSRPEARTIDVAVVQGSVPRPVAFDQDARITASHAELTERLAAQGPAPDLVVWPEGALGSATPDTLRHRAGELASQMSTHLLVGRTDSMPAQRAFENVVDHIGPSGETVATYRKRHPVPFGEYVPFGFLRGRMTTLDRIPYDMVRGTEATVFDVGGVRVATPICFESVFPRDVRPFLRSGAELIVVSTNNSSYERSGASSQHLAHARMRALESRQWVVQAALSGISAVVGPDGSVSHATGLFEQTVMRAQVQARPPSSLYARVGDVFAWGFSVGAALAMLGYAAWRVSGRARHEAAKPSDTTAPESASLR